MAPIPAVNKFRNPSARNFARRQPLPRKAQNHQAVVAALGAALAPPFALAAAFFRFR
jgi:hypothetical protein